MIIVELICFVCTFAYLISLLRSHPEIYQLEDGKGAVTKLSMIRASESGSSSVA